MTHEQIFEKHFNEKMYGVRLCITTVQDFKRDYKTLYGVIMDSLSEVERTTKANDLKERHNG